MAKLLKLWFLLIVVLNSNIFIKCEPDWTYDIISIDVECKTPDKAAIELEVVRVARGVFAVSGFMDFKEDITDQLHVSLTTYYSLYGSSFVRSPYYLPEQSISTCINTFYRDSAMESFLNCTENAPVVENVFYPPLTKRTIYLNNCKIPNDDMPSKVRSGYYKAIFQFNNQAEGHIDIIIKVEPK